MSPFSIEVLVISLKLVAPRLPEHSSGEVFAGDEAGLRSGGGLVGGSARGLIRDGRARIGAVGKAECWAWNRTMGQVAGRTRDQLLGRVDRLL